VGTRNRARLPLMKFYWCPHTRAFRIAWLLQELGCPHERVTIDIRDEAARADPSFRAVSPMGKVPALEDGPIKLWDSGAISVYLADAYPDAGLGVPLHDPKRGAFLQWVMYTNAVIEPAMVEKFAGAPENSPRHGYGSFNLMISTLNDGLAPGPWILGDRFTAADVLLGSSVRFLKMFGAMPEGLPVLEAYLERCRARPAYERAQAIEDAG